MRAPAVLVLVILVAAGAFAAGRMTSSDADVSEAVADALTEEAPAEQPAVRVDSGFQNVDLGGLTPDQRTLAVDVLNETPDVLCGCDDRSIAASLVDDVPICEQGRRLANVIINLARDGRTRNEIDSEVERYLPPPPPEFEELLVDSPTRGPDDAEITVVEFSCFSCGYSRKIQDTLAILERKYSGKIKHVFKFFPLGYGRAEQPLGLTLAQASLAARDHGKFWEFHDLAFSQYTELRRAGNDEEQLHEILRTMGDRIGVPGDALIAGIGNPAYTEIIDRDFAQGVGSGVRGTPYFLINGEPLNGAQPYCHFRKLFDDELTGADAAAPTKS